MSRQNRFYNKGITHIYIGVGEDISVNDLAGLIAEIVRYEGEIQHDISKPDGTPGKLFDVSGLKSLGWQNSINLYEGIEQTYKWYRKNVQ